MAVAAASMAVPGFGLGAGPVAAQEAGDGVVLVAQVSVDDPIGKSFGITSAPMLAPGTPPGTVSPIVGDVEVCARGSEPGGRVLVMFDEDSAVVLRQSGCETVALNGASNVTIQAQRAGVWDVVIRRLGASGGDTHLAASVNQRNALGVNVSLLSAPATAMGELPATPARYSGTVEVCVTAPNDGGQLVVYVNDDKLMEFRETGCQQAAVSDAMSATLVCTNGTWSAVVRRLG
jgi:hypothetical protein